MVFFFSFLFFFFPHFSFAADLDIEKINDFVRDREVWLDEDQRLLFPAPSLTSHDEWHLRYHKIKRGLDLTVFERSDPSGDANKLFHYWNDNTLNIPIEVATKVFSTWMDLGPNWTKETVAVRRLHITPEGEEIWQQYFHPNMIGVSKRELVSVCSTRQLNTDEPGLTSKTSQGSPTTLISCRSVPDWITGLSAPHKAYRIQWHGAYLLTADGKDRTKVRKIDRENQGGMFPAFLMNRLMPKFLDEEVLKTVEWINKHVDELKSRFEEGI